MACYRLSFRIGHGSCSFGWSRFSIQGTRKGAHALCRKKDRHPLVLTPRPVRSIGVPPAARPPPVHGNIPDYRPAPRLRQAGARRPYRSRSGVAEIVRWPSEAVGAEGDGLGGPSYKTSEFDRPRYTSAKQRHPHGHACGKLTTCSGSSCRTLQARYTEAVAGCRGGGPPAGTASGRSTALTRLISSHVACGVRTKHWPM